MFFEFLYYPFFYNLYMFFNYMLSLMKDIKGKNRNEPEH